jgi:hypothetical protein
MKNPSATTTIIVAVILVCALSTGGQQQSDKGQDGLAVSAASADAKYNRAR